MAKDVTITIKGDYTDRDIKRAIRDLQSLQKQAPKTTKSTTEMGRATDKLGYSWKGAALSIAAATVSIGAVTRAIGSSITAASDLAESQSKVRVVFGQSSKAIESWSDSSANALLMTKQQALEATGTFGNLLQAFGTGQADAQRMSQRLVELAADLSSFNNVPVDEVLIKLRSGLTGEQEAVKSLGIALTDARLRQEALNMGIYDGKGILDTYQKSQAAFALMLKDSSLAIGDVERTADGYANTMKSVEAAVGNAQATIGKEFLDAIQSVSKALGGAEGVVSLIDDTAEGVANLTNLATKGIGPIGELGEKIDNLKPDWAPSFFEFDIANGLGPVGRMLGLVSDTTAALDMRSEALGRTNAILYQGYVRMGPPIEGVAAALDNQAAGADRTATANAKAATQVDRLRASLDKLDGRRSITRQRIQLRKMLAEGPAQSGERTVMKDGKEVTERFSTKRDKRLFALDVADARSGLAQDIYDQGGGSEAAKARARKQFRLGRRDIKGFGLGAGAGRRYLATPEELGAGTYQQRIAGDVTGGRATQITYNFGDLIVKDAADAAEQARKAARLRALNSRQPVSAAS